MIRRLEDRLTYANVTATIALFTALGGGAYAAGALPPNSIGDAQLRKGSVRSAEVKDGTLKTRDLSAKARKALSGARGPAGPAGPTGPGGGGSGSLALAYKTATGTAAFGNVDSHTATCDPGQRVVGGGMRVETGSDTSLRESHRNASNTGWTVRVGNDATSGSSTYTVFAVCAGG